MKNQTKETIVIPSNKSNKNTLKKISQVDLQP